MIAPTYLTFDAAEEALRAGLADAGDDNPQMPEEHYAADIVEGVALSAAPEVAVELCLRELGWVPEGLKRLRPDIADVAAKAEAERGAWL